MILGITASHGLGVRAGSDMELISTTLLTGNQSSVTFSSLGDYSTMYKHLQVRMTARQTHGSVATVTYRLRLNADSGNNYADHELRATGTSVNSNAATSTNGIEVGAISTTVASTGIFNGAVIDIIDAYSTNKNKTIRSLSGVATGQLSFISGVWLSTSALTSIVFDAYGDNFVSGSRFSLYGIKG